MTHDKVNNTSVVLLCCMSIIASNSGTRKPHKETWQIQNAIQKEFKSRSREPPVWTSSWFNSHKVKQIFTMKDFTLKLRNRINNQQSIERVDHK